MRPTFRHGFTSCDASNVSSPQSFPPARRTTGTTTILAPDPTNRAEGFVGMGMSVAQSARPGSACLCRASRATHVDDADDGETNGNENPVDSLCNSE